MPESSAPPSPAIEPASEPVPEPTVLIVDDHDLVGTSLAYSLSAEGLDARRAASVDVTGVLAEAATSPVGLALLDLDLGRDRSGRRFDGVDLVGPLTERGWRCIVLSSTVDRTRIGAALAAGALAAVPKHAPFPLLVGKMRAALAGLPVMSPESRQRLIESHLVRDAERRQIAEKLERLTRREREVLAELARGHRAQAVADQYVVSLATVRTQIRSVLGKLEVGSQLEAVALYRRGQTG
jgi:DNA-binding NarL/FixJ family response regulator